MARYEVFISFKNRDAHNRPTKDSKMAESLYYAFQKMGIRTFYSNISIKESGESSYRKAIDRALGESRVMVVVGTSYEFISAPQVDAEVEQFRNDMLNGVKPRGESRLFTFLSGISVNELPDGLRQYQSFFEEKDVLETVCNFLKTGSDFRNFGGKGVGYQGSAEPSAPALPQVREKKEPCMEPGTVIDGRYKILNLIGRGGMSYVHLAFDEKIKRSVAVKEFRRYEDQTFDVVAQSLIAEIGLMKNLSHPAIPKIHDVINAGDSFIFVMDFVEGTSLNQVISETGVLKEESVIEVGRQLADVLHYLHNRPAPVIYRDMKPANVILKPDGKIMLIDFGAAREYKKNNLEDTTCLGTRGYAAPEQYGGMGQTDARTDIYTLGATLYHLVTGKSPGEPPYEMLPIRQLNPSLSYGLEYIIQTCVRNDPDKRFQSAAEVLAAFDNMEKLGNQAHRKALLKSITAQIAEVIPLSNKRTQKKRVDKKAKAFAIPGATASTPVAAPVPQQLQPPRRIESAMDTAVLSQIQPLPPVPPPSFYSDPTETLSSTCVLAEPEPAPVVPAEQPVPEVPVKPKTRKVTVRAKASSNPELDEMVAKLTALDPESQAIVRQLIDRLSQ